jgi:hypothetical protein
MKSKKNEFVVKRNSNYTITLIDCKGRSISFRDITGSDLEFIDSIVQKNGDRASAQEISFNEIVSLLEHLSTKKLDFRNLPQRTIVQIFTVVREQLFCNYMPKYDWLKRCYGIQNGSFVGLEQMEEVPLTKFMAMVQIHQEAIESMNKSPE